MTDIPGDLEAWWETVGRAQQIILLAEVEAGSDELSPVTAPLIFSAGRAMPAGGSPMPWPPEIRAFIQSKIAEEAGRPAAHE